MENWLFLVKLQGEASKFTKSSSPQMVPNQAKHHRWMHIFFCYKITLVIVLCISWLLYYNQMLETEKFGGSFEESCEEVQISY